MKLKMIKKLFLLGLLFLNLNSCSESKKSTSDFKFEKGESSLELKIVNGNDYLTYNKPIRTDFKLENIDPNTLSIFGAGIKILTIENGITKTEINVPDNYLESDTLNIKLRFEINGKETKTEFNVPIKREQ
ncbi:hypothetical protein FLP08_12755 [Gramella aestuarii]|uniref:Lipoprotein n=2 Tax=Christiangramia aestuarii TaxID=1028746 RepID=A0A7K1LRR8_9FLAO|nr:hypothetical protein [Christiangramia aestuarii]MUP43448.1 hypothetical protein [Christiangramia aestuarii]